MILATGGTLTVPEVSGVDGPNVVTTPALHRRVKPFLRFVGPGTPATARAVDGAGPCFSSRGPRER